MRRRKFHHRLLLTASALAITAVLNSCGGDRKTKVAFVTNATADFWVYAQAGIQKAEEDLGDVRVIFKVGDGTPMTQRKIIDDLIVSGAKGVAFSPTSPKDQMDMIKEWSDKAKVMTVDSDAPESERFVYLGTDNIAAGRACGELVKEALPDGGKIMVFVGIKSQLNAVERYQGLKEALEGSEVEVIDLRTDEVKPEVARRNAEDTLTKYPDVAGMVGLWSYNAPQILNAVRDAGKIGEVQIVAFDEDPITLRAIAAGEMYGTICQQPYVFGEQSARLLHHVVVQGKRVEDYQLPEGLELKDGQIFVPTITVRRDGALDYLKKCDSWKKEIK